jgi:hypothetical protein
MGYSTVWNSNRTNPGIGIIGDFSVPFVPDWTDRRVKWRIILVDLALHP